MRVVAVGSGSIGRLEFGLDLVHRVDVALMMAIVVPIGSLRIYDRSKERLCLVV